MLFLLDLAIMPFRQLEGASEGAVCSAGFDVRFSGAEYTRLDTIFCTDPWFSQSGSLQISCGLVTTSACRAALCENLSQREAYQRGVKG